MDNALTSFVLAAIAGLVLAGAAFWLSTKSGLQPAQAALIETLKDNADAMDAQVELLKTELATQKDRRMQLERKVAKLEAVVLELVQENSTLRKKLGLPPRRSVTAADIDDGDDDDASV